MHVMRYLHNSCNIAICDAPYNINIAKWDRIDNFYEWSRSWLTLCAEALLPNGSLFMWGQAYRNVDYMRLIVFCVRKLGMQMINEIIWCKNVGLTATKDRFVRSHESCFWLGKSATHVYNQQLIFSSGSSYDRFRGADADDDGIIKVKDLKVARELHAYNQSLARGAKDDDIFLDVTKPSKLCRDWWDDISNLHEKSSHGVKKQNVAAKNIALSTRMILAATNEGDSVLIPFGGTGSEVLASVQNKRRFIVIENDRVAYTSIINVLLRHYENSNNT